MSICKLAKIVQFECQNCKENNNFWHFADNKNILLDTSALQQKLPWDKRRKYDKHNCVYCRDFWLNELAVNWAVSI